MALRGTTTLALGLLALLATAGGAPAATLTTDRSCYRPGELIRATITGFPADSSAVFYGNGVRLIGADGAGGEETSLVGDGTLDVEAPATTVGTRTEELDLQAQATITDPYGSDTFVTAERTVQLIQRFDVGQRPTTASPRSFVTYTVTGATRLRPVYLHVTRRSLSTRRVAQRRTVRLGTPRPPCGRLTARVRRLGFANPRPGIYSRVVDEVAKGDTDPQSRRGRLRLPTVTVRR